MALEAVPIVMDANALTTIINNIHSLYNNLVNYTIAVILLVGAGIPSLISFFQNRVFRKEQTELKNQISSEIADGLKEGKSHLDEIIKQALDEEIGKMRLELNEIKTTFDKEIACTKGNSYHLQSNQNIIKFPPLCIEDCKYALGFYMEGEDERNARSILIILMQALENLDKEMLDGIVDVKESIDEIIKILQQNNTNGRYEHDLEHIREGFKQAKKREQKQT